MQYLLMVKNVKCTLRILGTLQYEQKQHHVHVFIIYDSDRWYTRVLTEISTW